MPLQSDHVSTAARPSSRRRNNDQQQKDMENQKAKTEAAAVARQHLLSSLKSTTVVISKPSLPNQIISRILDHTDGATLICCAQASRRVRDMVYDESRWIRKLASMRLPVGHYKTSAHRSKHVPGFVANHRSLLSPSTSDRRDPLEAIDAATADLESYPRQRYGSVHGPLHPFYSRLESVDDARIVVLGAFSDVAQQAKLLANLSVFALCDETLESSRKISILKTLSDRISNDTLDKFREASAARDLDRMRPLAGIAVTLGNGHELAQAHIDSHRLFRDEMALPDVNDCIDGVATGHVDLGPARDLFDLTSAAVSEQAELVDHVFPPTLPILQPFLAKLADDLIRPFVDSVFAVVSTQGSETLAKAISGLFKQSMDFADSVDSLKRSLGHEIRTRMSDIFNPRMVQYFADEQSLFDQKSGAIVTAWEEELKLQDARTETMLMSNVNRQAVKRDFLAVFKKVVLPSPMKSSDTANITDTKTDDKPSDAPTTELAAKMALLNSRLEGIKSLLSVQVALDLISLAKAGIERMAVFVRQNEQFQQQAMAQCDQIFVSLVMSLGENHVKVGFDKAISHLGSYSARKGTTSDQQDIGVAPLVTFLELVNLGDLIQQMVDVFYVQELSSVRPISRMTEDFLNPAVKAKKRFEQMLDERVATGLNEGIDVLIDQVEHLLATTQQAKDYNPLPAPGTTGSGHISAVALDIGPTRTAQVVVETVRNHTNMLIGSTNRQMLDVFFQEVGSRLFTVLCKHIKRQRISVDGAIILICDLNLYSELITSLKQKDLIPYFSALRELSQIYLVDCLVLGSNNQAAGTGATAAGAGGAAVRPTAGNDKARLSRAKELASIISDTDRYQGIFRVEEVYEFAQRRADWYAVKRDVEKAMYGMCTVM